MTGEVVPAVVPVRRPMPRWLLWAISAAALCGVLVLTLAGPVGDLLSRLITKIAPPDPYQLALHWEQEAAVRQQLAAEPLSAAAWLEAARFELADNSPHGAAWCLTQAKKHGASEAELVPVRAEIKEATRRWEELYQAFLKPKRYSDGNNVYSDIYPVLARLRGDESKAPVTGKVRADLDLLEAHLLLREGRRTEARVLLAALKEQPGPLQGLAAYLHAKTFLREADLAPARRAFREYLERFPGERLNAYAAYELGSLALQAGDAEAADQAFMQVIQEYAGTPQSKAALLATLDITFGVVPKAAPSTQVQADESDLFDLGITGAEAEGAATEPKEGGSPEPLPSVLPVAQEVPATIGGLDQRLVPTSAEGWALYGDLFEAGYTATEVQQRALALSRLLLTSDKPPFDVYPYLTPKVALGWTEALIAAGGVKGALALADWGVKQAGFPAERAQLARLRGRLLIAQREFTTARTGLEAVRGALAGQTDVAPLDYEIARTWRLGGNAGRARPFYQKAAQSADPELCADALAQSAWAAAQGGDWEAALGDYRVLVQKYPDSVYADVAREHLLTDALRKGNRDAALALAKMLEEKAHRAPRHVRGAYFRRQLEGVDQGEWQRFLGTYTWTYYGTLVAEDLGLSHARWDLDEQASALTFEELRQQERSSAGACWIAGLWDIAEAEWEAQGPDPLSMDGLRACAQALLTASPKAPRETILSAQEVLDRGTPARIAPGWTRLLLETSFPLEYLEPVETEAARYDFPPSLLLGIIRQESFFNPTAKSHAGARGLMQLMPRTGDWAAKQVGLGTVPVSQFEDPAVNIRLATWHLDFLRRNGATTVGPLLAAHNGGPGNLARWRERYGAGVDERLFLESIPNQESREFVRHVRANQAVYEWRLGQQSPDAIF